MRLIQAVLLVMAILPGAAAAQTFPTRSISVIVPFPPGSTSDLIPRALAPLMSQSMGVPVVVENRAGAGGTLGAAFVARGDASGHLVLMAPSAILAINQWLFKDLGYDPRKGPAPALQDVIAGRVPLMCDNFSNVIAHVRAGRLRAVAVTAMQRHPQAPEVPTANESGLAGFEVGIWYGFAVPAAAPQPVVQKLNAEFARALRDPKIRERFEQLGLAVVADSPEEFGRFVAAESERMRKLVEVSGARAD